MRGATCSRPKATGMLSRSRPKARVRRLPMAFSASATASKHVARQLVELLAVIGQTHRPCRAVKQPRPEMVFERRDEAAHRRLSGVGLTCDGGKASSFGDTDEHLHGRNDVHGLIRESYR
jgi:hypothetical protein